MKTLSSFTTAGVFGFIALYAVIAAAQYNGGGVSYHASTAAEGYARGMGDVIRSYGQAQIDTSQAAINYTQAQKQEIENRKQWTQTYFEMRRINREARAAESGPKRTQEDWIRLAQAGMPQRLSPSELDSVGGRLTWPILLRKDEYAKDRAVIDKAFTNRATSGTISPEDYAAVRQAIDSIGEQMKKEIRNVSSMDFTTAQRFLKNLNFESRQPAG